VLILNNDVTIGPDWLGTLLTAATTENAWFAVGKLVRQNEPTTIDGTYDAISRGGTPWRCGNNRPDGPVWSERRSIRFLPLTAALIQRRLFDDIGLLDEHFESYLEDIDFGLRCAISRRQGIYVPEAVATHKGSATLGAWHKATVRRISRNQVLLIRKYFRGAPLWPILVAHVLWGGTAFRHRTGWAWLSGKWEGLRDRLQQPGCEWAAIRDAVYESESEIQRLQAETGFDWYWKAYFFLAGVR
jgi:GT2 family glycosyltransferase